MTATEYLLIAADSDRKTHEDCLEECHDAILDAQCCDQLRDGIWTLEQATLFTAAEAIKEYYETRLDDPAKGHDESTGCLISQLVQSALNDIDWQEMAQHYLTKIAED